MKAYWWRGRPNFGDAVAPLLLSRFAGLDVTWDVVSRASVVSIGSVLEHIPPGWEGYVLGSGRLYPNSRLHLEGCTILGLRGPLSAAACPYGVTLGDPGLLADELVPVQSRTWDLGIVPHWSDTELAHRPEFYRPSWTTTVISPADDPLDVITRIGQCRKIVASSLHGLIVADAFGIPRRFEYTPRFDAEGGMFKFEDYSASIGSKVEAGVIARVNQHVVDDRKHEIWDCYRMLGKLVAE